MILHRGTTDESRIQAVAQLNAWLADAQAAETPVLFLLSGGSSFALLDGVDTTVYGPWLTLAMLDDRYSEDPAVNNAAQLMATPFFSQATAAGAEFVDTRVQEGETLDQYASRYEAALHAWESANPNGKMIAIVGMGPDGHIAGMMPYPHEKEHFTMQFTDTAHWITGYDAGHRNPHPFRATATASLLERVDQAVACILGDEKAEVLNSSILHTNPPHELPGVLLHNIPELHVFTDISQ